jgi:hypothetical protein
MKALFTAFLLSLSCLTFAQINTAPANPPLINFTGLPFDLTFEIKKLILNEYLSNNANPSGADLVLLQSIDSKIAANGLLAGSKVYALNAVPFKYYSRIVLKIIEENPYQAMKKLERFGRKKAILRQMKTQFPMIIRQIVEMNGSASGSNYVELDSAITQ